MPAHYLAVAKLLFILVMAGALVEGLASSHSEPPLLIDASQTTPTR